MTVNPIDPGPELPEGHAIDLPGRGTTFVRYANGPAGAPTLFMLHGWTVSADLTFFPVWESLTRHFNVITLDHRGHGRGIRSKTPFKLRDCADDVAAVCEQIGVTSIIALGYSMGGPIAQLLWKRHRRLVSGLVLAATTRNFASSARERRNFYAMGAMGLGARALPNSFLHEVGGKILAKRTGRDYEAWMLAEINRNDWRMILEAGSELGRFDSREWAHEISVPTSVIVTTQDQLVSPLRQAKLAADIKDAKVFEVECAHTGIVVSSDIFVPTLVQACLSVSERINRNHGLQMGAVAHAQAHSPGKGLGPDFANANVV